MSVDFAIERIIWLHKRIKDGYYPNAMRLSERFGISHRQAQRDCDYLRSKLEAPVAFDRSKQGYYYTESFSLPDSIRVEDPRDISNIVALADMMGDDGESTQIGIPYTALLRRLSLAEWVQRVDTYVSSRISDFSLERLLHRMQRYVLSNPIGSVRIFAVLLINCAVRTPMKKRHSTLKTTDLYKLFKMRQIPHFEQK